MKIEDNKIVIVLGDTVPTIEIIDPDAHMKKAIDLYHMIYKGVNRDQEESLRTVKKTKKCGIMLQ